jgi:hypothetical protein
MIRNMHCPPLTRKTVKFFYLLHANETPTPDKYKLMDKNLHISYKDIPREQKALADPEIWLTKSELEDWTNQNLEELEEKTTFSESDEALRQRFVTFSNTFLLIFFSFCDIYFDYSKKNFTFIFIIWLI